MKAGLTSSIALHVVVLAFGILTFSSPKPFEMGDTESFPVDIVPLSDISQVQQGEKTAPMKEKAAPKPTTKPQTVENAENVGDQSVDLKTPPKPSERPKPVETAEEAKNQPMPVEKPEPAPDPKPDPKPQPKPVPATEQQTKPAPKQDVQPDPVKEAIEKTKEAPDPDTPKLPDNVPAPTARPKPPEMQTAKTNDRKPSEESKPTKTASQQSSAEKDAVADEVAQLLNKDKGASGGARRSSDQASLGGNKTTGGNKLSQTQIAALQGMIQKCWSIPGGLADAQNMQARVEMKLTQSGEIDGTPTVKSIGSGDAAAQRTLAESARRAVQRCAPYNLPAESYNDWREINATFSPPDM